MEKRSVSAQTTRPHISQLLFSPHWMRHFFTEDLSPDNRLIVEFQRRAVWIALALILQSLNEIDRSIYLRFLDPIGLRPIVFFFPFVLMLCSFFAMWMALRPTRQHVSTQRLSTQPARWQRAILILTIIPAIIGGIQFSRGIMMCFMPPTYSNDGTALDTNAAILLLEGRNPYRDSNLIEIARRFPIQPNWTTPLRVGQFEGRLNYPTMFELRSVLDTGFKAGDAPEFEAKVSYPALSFLTLVPLVLLNIHNVLPFYMLSYLLLVAVAWKMARPELRPWLLLLAMANIPMWSSTIGGNLDVFATLLVVLAWLYRDQRWTSTLFLGLAIASKQPAWFFVPFYALLVWRTYDLKESIYRLAIVGIVGLAINMPFILWDPHAWLAGIMAPVSDPMFPMGVGIITLSTTHVLPYLPGTVYTLLELTALALCLLWYWRICQRYPEAVMLLAVIPLFFAWRSLPSYFYCSAFPILVLLSARRRYGYLSILSTSKPSLAPQHSPLAQPVGIKAPA